MNEFPCHHNLEQFLDEGLNASGLANSRCCGSPCPRRTCI